MAHRLAGTGSGPAIAPEVLPMLRVLTAVILGAAVAHAEPLAASEAEPELPSLLTLEKAREIFRQRGFDLLVADANVLSAQGDLAIAGALQNPGVSLSAGKNFDCAASQDCKDCARTLQERRWKLPGVRATTPGALSNSRSSRPSTRRCSRPPSET